MRILIVEDHPITLWSIQEGLSEKGYSDTYTATHAKEALMLFRKHRPDLVLLDINLLNHQDAGIELAHIFRAIRRIPIIFLTGESKEDIVRKAIQARPINYLIKPIDFDELAINIELAVMNFHDEALPTSGDEPWKKLNADIILQKGNTFFFKKRNRFEKVLLSDILWVQAENIYTDICLKTGRETLSMTLKRFEAQVSFPSLIKVNRSQMVNVNHVDSFEPHRLFIGTNEFKITDKHKQGFYEAFKAA